MIVYTEIDNPIVQARAWRLTSRVSVASTS